MKTCTQIIKSQVKLLLDFKRFMHVFRRDMVVKYSIVRNIKYQWEQITPKSRQTMLPFQNREDR